MREVRVGQQAQRPVLRLVEDHPNETLAHAWFCGHCAARSPGDEAPPPAARVCGSCGLGLFLEARVDVVPRSGDAFVVVDPSLQIQAVSVGAERLLAVSEEMAIDQPVAQVLVPADADSRGASFAAVVGDVMASERPLQAFVRPGNTFGVRMRARIAVCGPPRAALILLETPQNLRLVRP